MKSRDRVCIGIVNDGSINSDLVVDLLHIATKRADKFDSMVQVANIGLLTRSRNVLVKNFLTKTDAAWLLMLDADERLPLSAWDLLVNAAHDQERPVVSALVFAAFFDDDDNLRPVPTLYAQTEDRGLVCMDAYPENTLIQVDAAGTGCLLIHRSVLLTMQANATAHQGPEWSWFVDGAIDGRWFGEDLLFSKRLASLGIPVHAHTGAILKHRKKFWLDERHHQAWLEANTN